MLWRNIYQVQSAFQQAGKGEELIALLEQIDLRAFGQSSRVFNLISNMFYDDKHRDAATRLFKKVWKEFPDDRSLLLNYVRNDQIWQMPEMYEYALETVIPKPGTFVPLTQWNILGQILAYVFSAHPALIFFEFPSHC